MSQEATPSPFAGGIPPPVLDEAREQEKRLLFVLFIVGLALPAALAMGFVAGEDLKDAIAVAGGVFILIGVAVIPISLPVKLLFMVLVLTFLQRVFGYFKLGELRGLNPGNLLLLCALCYWFLQGLRKGRIYSPTPVDLWLVLALIAIPLFSLYYTASFRKMAYYDLNYELSRFKQWITPFIYFFLVTQLFEKRKDVRLLIVLLLSLVGLAVLQGLPEMLRSGDWRNTRSEGIVAQPNEYAALMASMAPFLFLALLLLRRKPLVQAVCLGFIAVLAFSIMKTYSRAGYMSFAIGMAGSFYLAYRALRRSPISASGMILVGASMLPLVASPDLLDSIQDRFKPKSYARASRKSYDQYKLMNQYSGDRLVLWRAALLIAEKQPIFGVGFHAYPHHMTKYHPKGWMGINYPHNVFLGTLAEGGIIWLSVLLVFFYKLYRVLEENWELVLSQNDTVGHIICGGGLLAFWVMIWTSCSNDFFNPGPKNGIYWVMMAATIRYGMLARHGDVPEAAAKA
jgi:O-antigen ligase